MDVPVPARLTRTASLRKIAVSAALALLLAFLGLVGAPAYADPPDVPVPPHSGTEGPTDLLEGWQYSYDSLEFWLDDLGWVKGEGPEEDAITWGDEKFTLEEVQQIADQENSSPSDEPLSWDDEGMTEKQKKHRKSGKWKWKVGTLEHVLARWANYLAGSDMNAWNSLSAAERYDKWSSWLIVKYIIKLDQNPKGAAFETLLNELFGYRNLGFRYNKAFPGEKSRGDFFYVENDEVLVAIEAKSGVKMEKEQLDEYQAKAESGTRVIYISGVPLSETKVTELTGRGFEVYYVPTVPTPYRHKNAPEPPDTGTTGGEQTIPPTDPLLTPPGSLAPEGQYGQESASTEAFADSPSSPEEAEADAQAAEEYAEDLGYDSAEDAELTTDPLGGVDFATLELRYVSDTYDGGLGSGAGYAYQVDPAEDVEVSYGGREAGQLAADSFFTWLALHPSSFTVNLNPDEPDRIIDAEFGKTDAGRVLLEADLQLKRSVGEFIHPDTDLGAQFWDALQGETKCMSMRQWIVPKPAVVHEDEDELFILDAPLEVKMETEYLQAEGVGGDAGCTGQPQADTEANEQVYRDLILPKVEEAVNTAPEYADLRRVYASRVAAEWFRERDRAETTAYSDIIDSGDAGPWHSRVPWDPEEVFDRYVQSYTEGEFEVEHTTEEGNYLVTSVYVYGGVNFSEVPKQEIGADAFDAEHPELAAAVDQALLDPTAEEGTEVLWLGGQVTERPPWNPFPMPASPLANPWFYILTGLPVLTWMLFGGYLIVRRRLDGSGKSSHADPVATGTVTS